MAWRCPGGGNGRRHRTRCCPSSKPPARPRARSPAPRDAQLKSLKLEFVISCQLSPRCRVAVGVLGWDGTVGPTGLIDEVPWQRDAYHLAVGQERQITGDLPATSFKLPGPVALSGRRRDDPMRGCPGRVFLRHEPT